MDFPRFAYSHKAKREFDFEFRLIIEQRAQTYIEVVKSHHKSNSL